MDAKTLFNSLDKEFVNIDKIEDETFFYKGADVLVQSTWELPIIIQWPGSTLNYEFSTAQGAIEFGIVFVPALDEDQEQNELEVETIEDMGRIRSDLHTIEGTYYPPSEGVVFFLWDNTYDWSAVKKLTYSVECHQPSFTLPDQERSNDSRAILADIIQDCDVSATKLKDSRDLELDSKAAIKILESQLAAAQAEYKGKLAALNDVCVTEEGLLQIVNGNNQRIAGLGIRCLNKHVMSIIIGYLDMTKEVSYVCKYWKIIIKGNLVNLISDPEKKRKVLPSKENNLKLISELKSRRTENSRDVIRIPESDNGNNNGDTYNKILKWIKPIVPKSWENDEKYNSIKSSNIMKVSNTMHKNYNGSNSKEDLSVRRVQWSNSVEDGRRANNVVVRGSTKNSGTYQSTNGFDNNKNNKNDDDNKNGNGDNNSEVRKNSDAHLIGNASLDSIENDNVQESVHNNFEKKQSNHRGHNGKKRYSEEKYDDEGIEYEGDYENEEEEEEDSPRITIKSRGNKQNGKNGHGHGNGNGENGIISKYGIQEEDGEMKQIMLDDDDDEKSAVLKVNSPTLIGSDNIVNRENNSTVSTVSATTDSSAIKEGEIIEKNESQSDKDTLTKKSEEMEKIESEKKNEKKNGIDEGTEKKSVDENVEKKYDHLLTHVKDIRSEKQLTDLIEFIQDGYTAIEQADNDKRKLKRRIKAWTLDFEIAHKRAPSSSEKKNLAREMYESYQRASATLTVRCDKVNHILATVGLSHQGFLKLRNKYFEWQEEELGPELND